MSVDGWHTILVLGGIRSGKSEFAESLVAQARAVRYVATAAGNGHHDPEWRARLASHRERRPVAWTTEETGADPQRLSQVIRAAGPDETLLVDDLGGWVTVLLDPAHQPADDLATIADLAAAVRESAARLILVSPEVGLSLVPTTPVGRAFADALGSTNQAIAAVCDSVVLVVAGQPTWLRAAGTQAGPVAIPAQPRSAQPTSPSPDEPDLPSPAVLRPAGPEPAPPATANPSWTAPTMDLPVVATGPVIQPGMDLPLPDENAAAETVDHLAALDLPGAGLGRLRRVVEFAASTQGSPVPRAWRSVRVLLLYGDHAGGCAAGSSPGESARRAAQAGRGEGPLARLAAEAGASLQVVEAPAAAPIEDGPALSAGTVERALRYGWRLVDEAVNDGVEMIVLAACGAGTDAAATAVLAATAGAEPAAVLGRVITPDGQVDDTAWMRRCAAVRDALRRVRHAERGAKDVLAHLGGGDLAVATGILLGAAARRTPVLLDGPVGVATALLTRELASQARHWCLLPDDGGHPGVRRAADVLGLAPLVDLRLDLGEGATALATLPMLRSALALAAALPRGPDLGGEGEPDADQDGEGEHEGQEAAGDGEEFVEPEPEGPGPTSTEQPSVGELEVPEPAERHDESDGEAADRPWFTPADAPRGG